MGRMETIGDAALYLGDCREIMPTLGHVDHVITDPPYSERTHVGHDAIEGVTGQDRRTLGYGFLSPEDVGGLALQFAEASTGWIVWMCDSTLAPVIDDRLRLCDRYVFAPLPFYAPGSRVRLTGDGPSSWTIWIMVARTRALHKWGTLPGGYLVQPGWGKNERMGGKPLGLMTRIVGDYSRAGEVVLDPFMGAGTTGVGCIDTGRKFVGIEIDPEAFDIACERIDAAQRQARLFG
jgi:site-specific DNA-methyltransferase (adenine-specific)